MNAGRAASAGRARRVRRAIAGASVAALALVGAAAAMAAGPSPAGVRPAAGAVVWIAAQPNAAAVGLDPVASQLSRDGRTVGFVTAWSGIDPGDVHGDPDVFSYAVATGRTQRINVTPGAVTYGNGWLDSLSADGSIMSLTTGSPLAAADTNGQADVYVLDRAGNGLQRVSVGPAGDDPIGSAGPSRLSADGRVVAFTAVFAGAVPGRTVWVRDLAAGTLQAASVAHDGQPTDGGAELGTISDNGRYVSFWSTATNL